MRKLTILILFGILLTTLVSGQKPEITPTEANKQTTTVTTTSAGKELTATDVEALLDGMIPQQLAQDDIAGATIAIVKDGKLLFSKGYGYADVANKKPVLANETLFRPASISKLFIWTAVMQLVEQGKLDLDKDVNEYLDFKIPEAFSKPITLKNILTHTSGFEEQLKDTYRFGSESPSLGEYLKTHLPTRVYAPGTIPAYSNYASGLAGYIVERVSGRPFNEYVEENIFKPLKMNHSTFSQPLPSELAPKMSGGYRLASGDAQQFEIVSPYPAGCLSTTADDIAQFMLAHLQNGRLGDAQILKPETVKLMHSNLFSLDPAANAMAHGFIEGKSRGLRIIGHNGVLSFFRSDLRLIEEKGVGFFISYNSSGRNQSGGQTAVWNAFLDRYFPAPPSNEPTLETAKQDAQTVAGTYLPSRMSVTTILKTYYLMGSAKVTANEDGTIQVSTYLNPNGKPKKWREVAPLTFKEIGGDNILIFKPDETGRMQIILPSPTMVLRRVGLWENFSLILPVLEISLGIMALTLILWFVAWWVRKHYGQKLELSPTDWRLRLMVRLVFALNLIFFISFIIFSTPAATQWEILSDKNNTWFWLIQSIAALASLGSLVVFYNAVRTWLSKNFGIWMKIQSTIFALACLGVLWYVFAGNVLSFKLNY